MPPRWFTMVEKDPQRRALRVAATAGNEAEAELMRQRLAEAGILATSQRSVGGAEWGASGTRYVYVEAPEVERAREILNASADLSKGELTRLSEERLLTLDVYISNYKPVPSAVPDWPESWQATWPATTCTLISGERDAVLVDSLLTMKESEELAKWLRSRGKNLTEVYITHAHGDHFFGLNSVLEAFPNAKPVALAEIVPLLEEQTVPEWMEIWRGFFPDQLTDRPIAPGPLKNSELRIESHTLKVTKMGQSDVADSTLIHIPELDAVLAGDAVYNNIHPWMYQSDHAQRMAWVDTLNQIEELVPTTIIAGHKDPHAPDDDAARTLQATRQYIRDFDAVVAGSKSGAETVSAMTEKHPDLGNPYTLWLAAYTQPYDG